jgi:hypothetical protein
MWQRRENNLPDQSSLDMCKTQTMTSISGFRMEIKNSDSKAVRSSFMFRKMISLLSQIFDQTNFASFAELHCISQKASE